MKLFHIALLCLIATTLVFAQDQVQAPPGVNYKPAPDSVNEAAKTALQKTLAGDKTFSKQVLADSITCGPMLWQAMKGTADKKLVDAKKMVAVIGDPKPTATDGRIFATNEERETFWRELFKKYPALATAHIRKATAWEIGYYWATVPFDIEEPFFAVEAGSDIFIVNMHMINSQPTIFWIDLVSDFQKMINKEPAATAASTEQKN